jgi:hypothetical protein
VLALPKIYLLSPPWSVWTTFQDLAWQSPLGKPVLTTTFPAGKQGWSSSSLALPALYGYMFVPLVARQLTLHLSFMPGLE